jgi:hypothetical protein
MTIGNGGVQTTGMYPQVINVCAIMSVLAFVLESQYMFPVDWSKSQDKANSLQIGNIFCLIYEPLPNRARKASTKNAARIKPTALVTKIRDTTAYPIS